MAWQRTTSSAWATVRDPQCPAMPTSGTEPRRLPSPHPKYLGQVPFVDVPGRAALQGARGDVEHSIADQARLSAVVERQDGQIGRDVLQDLRQYLGTFTLWNRGHEAVVEPVVFRAGVASGIDADEAGLGQGRFPAHQGCQGVDAVGATGELEAGAGRLVAAVLI